MKRNLKIHFLIIVISLTSLLGGYMHSLSVPIYASDDWETLTSNEQLVDAFKVYCKSRNIAIDGSVLDAVTSFTTTTFNNICNTLGINITQLQAEIQRTYSGAGYKYAFSALGLSGMNRIFAEFLQNNDLAVGDSADEANNTVYSGEYFQDADGYGCLVWDMPSVSNTDASVVPNVYGNKYKYDYFDVANLHDHSSASNLFSFHLTQDLTHSLSIFYTSSVYDPSFRETITEIYSLRQSSLIPANVFGEYINNVLIDGKFIIFRVNNGSALYFGKYTDFSNLARYPAKTWLNILSFTPSDDDITDTNIYITTNNNTINNETVINEGDTIIYNNDGTPDSGGGSGGDQDPDQDDDWDPSVPTIPPAGGGTGDNTTIDWPDIDIPDFNLPDFSLGDITDKFPFSIPFDLVALLTVLDGEPIAPHIEGTIPLGSFYTWDLDFDFSQFDNYARIFRAFEFIGFCIGLIYFTVRIVKG